MVESSYSQSMHTANGWGLRLSFPTDAHPSASAVLQVPTPSGRHLEVRADGLCEESLAEIPCALPLSAESTGCGEDRDQFIAARVLTSFIAAARTMGAEVSATVPHPDQDLVSQLLDMISNPDGTVSQAEKARVKFREIIRPECARPLAWVHISHPNQATLQNFATTFGVKMGDLRSCLTPNNPPSSYRYGDYLVNRFVELAMSESGELDLVENSVTAILGKDFLVTISDEPSRCCDRVWQEITDGTATHDELLSSNHLFSRILGASLHTNEGVAHEVEMAAQAFAHTAGRHGPSPHLRQQFRAMSEAILDAARALENNKEVIHSLREPRNLFGSPEPRTALDRYTVIQETTDSRLNQAREFLAFTRADWRVAQEERQNSTLYRLTLLSGALTPTALVASLFGMNFPDGLPYSSSTMYYALGTSFTISCALVGTLALGRWFGREL